MSINEFVIAGRIAQDPEHRNNPEKGGMLKITVAVNRDYTDSEGNRGTDFIDVAMFGKRADAKAPHLAKGQYVVVKGSIEHNAVVQEDGSKRWFYNFKASDIDW
jgi:single-strand DNA-binding protein